MEIRTIREVITSDGSGAPRILEHAEWRRSWPWLVQGTTTRGLDFALDGPDPAGAWAALRAATPSTAAFQARQTHGVKVGVRGPIGPGLHLVGGADGHVTGMPGALLGVTVADCVPVSIVAPRVRAVGMVHAGWRGSAAGILERAIERMSTAYGAEPVDLHLHLGPSICGSCYEVGPEVHEALGFDPPDAPTPIDLRAVLARRAGGAGVTSDRVTRSAWCTLCGGGDLLYSHRGGDAGRQLGFIGLSRDPEPPGVEPVVGAGGAT